MCISVSVVVSLVFPESPCFDDSLGGILQVDAVFGQVTVAPVVLEVFCFISLGLCRGGSRTPESTVLELGIGALYKNTLGGTGQWSVTG